MKVSTKPEQDHKADAHKSSSEEATLALRSARTLDDSFIDRSFPEQDGTSEVDPSILEDGADLYLAYRRPEWSTCAVVVFELVSEWNYGGPNDEALAGRNLWGLGLRPYAFHTVSPSPGPDITEWFVTFHDGLLRVVAHKARVQSESTTCDSPVDALNGIFREGAIRLV